jgi:flagellar secretion chaperone FliS
MRTKRYQSYYEDELVDASPLKLVQLLYRGALDAIASARRFVRLGDIPSRARAIAKAMAIVTELSRSLNTEQGGEVSRNLAQLYGYVEKLLMQANFEQREKPLEEAERLLETLAEAWTALIPEERASASQTPAESETHQPVSCAY